MKCIYQPISGGASSLTMSEKPRPMSPADEDEEKGYERKALKVHGIKLFALAFSTLGIIYSDIGAFPYQRNPGLISGRTGTSPLYVLNGIWPASGPVPPEEDIIGGLSAIIWSLTLLPLLKYVCRPSRLNSSAHGVDRWSSRWNSVQEKARAARLHSS